MDLREKIRDIPDFPKKGILFRDITPLLADAVAFRQAIDALAERYADKGVDVVVGIESRGFVLGAPLALRLGLGFVPVRKLGKLPWETVRAEYALEYGTNCVEIHKDAVAPGSRVLIVDDLLATGGTAKATIDLVSKLGGEVLGLAFLVELTELNGRSKLRGHEVSALISY